MVRSIPFASLAVAALAVGAPAPGAAQGVIDYSPRNERMNAAMAKGRATLATFDDALRRPLRGALLNVRVPYGVSGNEYLWLNDVRKNPDGSYDGRVTDVVVHVPGLHQGSRHHAERADVADWMFRDDAGDHGGWTVRVMRDDMAPARPAADGFDFVD